MKSPPLRPLILALAVAMAPLIFQLPAWTVGWCGILWGYLLFGQHRGWPLPSRAVRLTIFAAGMTVVLIFAGLRFDGGDFIALLAVMAGIKPMEVRSRRDSMVTVFLAYFLVIASLFVFENLAMTLYLFASVWVTTGVLIHVNHPGGKMGAKMRLSARLVATAAPLMVLLFLLFPRGSGSLWGAPWLRQGRAGFATSLSLGDVSQLALTDDPAFAATFAAAPPPPEQRYWRGIVFERFDGRTWHPARETHRRRQQIRGTAAVNYTVILEPHGRRHLFALDLPVSAAPAVTLLDDHTLVARRPVRHRLRYTATSLLDSRQPLPEPPGPIDLQLPPAGNPRTLALGRRLAQTYDAPDRVVAAALDLFRQDFVYTLRPGRLGVNAVDDFLFERRRGFCEHFAGAFAMLMRAAGIPARLVGGYQGGRWNAMGAFLSVRQSDAHVWCEVWLADRGWVRVDPTFVVAPQRIDAGIAQAIGGDGLPAFLGRRQGGFLTRWTDTLGQTWEALNIRWNFWFMGFSADEQLALLQRLGLGVGRRGLWLGLALLPPLFIGAAILFRRRRQTIAVAAGDDALRIYNRFLQKMRRAGFSKAAHQGPRDFARQTGARCPRLAAQVNAITGTYVALRYGPPGHGDGLKTFRRQVARFDPRPDVAAGRRDGS